MSGYIVAYDVILVAVHLVGEDLHSLEVQGLLALGYVLLLVVCCF